MSEKPIRPLRQRMLEDMNMRRFVPDTQREYIRAVKRVATFLGRSPDTATAEELRAFQLHLTETGTSICNRNRIMTGVRFLFRVTLRRAGSLFDHPCRSCQHDWRDLKTERPRRFEIKY